MKLYKEWLQANGFRFEEKTFGLVFKYQGATLIIFNNEDDSQYLKLDMPHIFKCDSENILQTLTVINKINETVKAVKATLDEDNIVSLCIEMFIDSTPDIDDFMIRLCDILIGSRVRFNMLLKQF